MSTAASAVTTVDSATTNEKPVVTEFNGWDEHGTPIRIEPEPPPKAQDSAPAPKKDAAADSAPQKDDKTKNPADSASDSATDKDQKPHLKTKEDTDRRFKEILDENKTLKQRLDALEKGSKTSETRDSKPASQPAAEAKVPPLKSFLKEYFAKPENKGKEYEDGVDAWQTLRDAEAGKQLELKVRQQIANEAAAKKLQGDVEQAKTRYADFDMEKRILPAVEAIATDQGVPFAVKEMVNGSPVFIDLMYVLSDPAALQDLIQTAKTNPAAAIRKIVLTEQLVQAELAKASGKDKADDKAGDKSGTERDASGKFVSSDKDKSSDGAASETKPRAPKPISDIGGRGSAPDDPLRTAAAANDFKAFDAGMKARLFKKA